MLDGNKATVHDSPGTTQLLRRGAATVFDPDKQPAVPKAVARQKRWRVVRTGGRRVLFANVHDERRTTTVISDDQTDLVCSGVASDRRCALKSSATHHRCHIQVRVANIEGNEPTSIGFFARPVHVVNITKSARIDIATGAETVEATHVARHPIDLGSGSDESAVRIVDGIVRHRSRHHATRHRVDHVLDDASAKQLCTGSQRVRIPERRANLVVDKSHDHAASCRDDSDTVKNADAAILQLKLFFGDTNSDERSDGPPSVLERGHHVASIGLHPGTRDRQRAGGHLPSHKRAHTFDRIRICELPETCRRRRAHSRAGRAADAARALVRHGIASRVGSCERSHDLAHRIV
mmetsp:Transcript_9412/g.25051  ORF Transcript_9412/g.25051 Transcript_9412/m.25051 type:complete len:350 (-) Transcript_9412:113-1162(-)